MLLLDVPGGARPACLAFSADGARLAVGCARGDVIVWDLATRAVVTRHNTGGQAARQVSFTPAGGLLGLADGGRLLSAMPGEAYWQGVGPDGRVRLVAVLPDGTRALCCLHESAEVGLFVLGGFRTLWSRRFDAQAGGGQPPGDALACSTDGEAAALAHTDGHVSVLLIKTGATFKHLFSGSRNVDALAVAPGGKAIACLAGQFLHFHRLSPTPDSNHHRLNERPYLGVAWHPSGAFFATTKGDGNVDLWDGITGERRESFGWGVGHLTAVAFDASGDRAAACSEDGRVVIWDIDG